MNKLFSKLKVAAAFSAMTLVPLVSCVNEEYDLSKGIDMDMQLLQNTALPVGSVPEVSVQKLLETAGSSSLLNVDDKGNLSLQIFKDTLTHTYTVPQISISGNDGLRTQSVNVQFMMNANYTGIPGDELAELLVSQFNTDHIYYCEDGITLNPDASGLEREVLFELDFQLPEDISSVRRIELDGTLNLDFRVSQGAIMHLADGFVLEFPDYMVLEPLNPTSAYKIVGGNKVVFSDDITISGNSPFQLALSLLKLDNLEGYCYSNSDANGEEIMSIYAKDYVKASGNLYLKASDYGYTLLPEQPELNMELNMSDLNMTTADVIVDLDMNIEDNTIQISALPDIFSGENTVVDLYNPILHFILDNASPLDMNLNAEITALCGDDNIDIHLGDNCHNGNRETEPIVIPADNKIEYYFSRQGNHGAGNGEDIKLDKISDIITNIPEQITIHDITVTTAREYIKVYANQQYNVNMEYELYSPLSFGEDLNISFNYDINLGIDGSSIDLDSFNITMDMVNTIPLDFKVKGVILDKNDMEVSAVDVDLDLDLKSGSLDNPVTSPVEIELSMSKADVDISKLRLLFTATSDTENIGVAMNNAQGLSINGIKVWLPEGIKIDLDNQINK